MLVWLDKCRMVSDYDPCFLFYRSCKKLSTVGSPFWMAPEVINGEHYTELVSGNYKVRLGELFFPI